MSKRKDPLIYGLSRRHTRKKARDFLDMDYIDKLTDEEKLWLARFAREHYQAAFTGTDKDIHTTKEDKRKVYGDNNARERDMWNKFDRVFLDPTNIEDEDDEESK